MQSETVRVLCPVAILIQYARFQEGVRLARAAVAATALHEIAPPVAGGRDVQGSDAHREGSCCPGSVPLRLRRQSRAGRARRVLNASRADVAYSGAPGAVLE